MLDIGYAWPTESDQPRRISMISMPCDSAGAGIVALGALIRGLCLEDANDLELHYDSLLKHAKQYLQFCKNCNLPHCAPEIKGCGFVAKADGRIKSTRVTNKVFTISDDTDFVERKIVCVRKALKLINFATSAASLYIHGNPEPQLANPVGQLPPAPYRQVINGALIRPVNLKKTYSGLCLAGRTSGENAVRERMASIRFKDDVSQYALDELLSIHGWTHLDVSRVSYFNARTGKIDRILAPPRLLIADGDVAFLKTISMPEFQGSDIVGVISRTIDRDSLETVGNKVQGLHQWYETDDDLMGMLPSTPRGISIAIMRRRQ